MTGRSPVAVFFGWILMAVGGLVALTCGLCTLGVAGLGVWGAFQQNGGLNDVASTVGAASFGAIPTAAGVAMFILGRRLARPRAGPGHD